LTGTIKEFHEVLLMGLRGVLIEKKMNYLKKDYRSKKEEYDMRKV